MNSEIYYQIHQLDGRIENFHLSVMDINIFLDMISDLRGKIKGINSIQKDVFRNSVRFGDTIKKVRIHDDLYKPNDAQGVYIGYLEHYEL